MLSPSPMKLTFRALIGAAVCFASVAAGAASAPISASASLSPFVALSAFSSSTSSAALCAAALQGASVLQGATAIQSAAVLQGSVGTPGCVLPAMDPAPPVVSEVVPAQPFVPAAVQASGFNFLPVLGVLAVIAALAIGLRAFDNGNGNPAPISPN